MTFARETLHTARKSHRCDACGQRIEAGERYIRWAGMCDGEFGAGAYHPDCREWEIKLCREFDLDADDWRSLSDIVAEDGPIVLDDAPEAVRARFGLAETPGVAAAPSDALAPASPCVGACGLDDAGACRGCGRTAGEIAGWREMGDSEKRAVLGRIAARGVDAGGAR